MSSTAYLPKAADPAQMSEWTRTAFTVEATVYYPKRMIIGAIGTPALYYRDGVPVGSWIPLVRTELGYEGLDLRHTEYGACKRAMEAAGVRVKT